jgi:hypothetical protein
VIHGQKLVDYHYIMEGAWKGLFLPLMQTVSSRSSSEQSVKERAMW